MKTIPVAALACIVALNLGAGPAQAQTINWQDHKINPKGFWATGNEYKFAEDVSAATKGRLKINVFPSGSSGFKGTEALDAVSENLLQIAEVWGGHVAGQEQVMEILDLPQFVPGDFEFRVKLWDALYPHFAKLLADKYGVWLLDMMQIDPRRMYTKKAVANLSDIKGLKLRAIGPADAAFTRALGAEATTTNWTELYTALQQGVVDGHWAADGAQVAMKFYEVTHFIFDTANAGPSFFIAVNKKALDGLPADVRQAFLAQRDTHRARNRKSYTGGTKWARGKLLEKGMKVNKVSAQDQAFMQKVAKPIVSGWAARLDPESRKIFDLAKSMIDAHLAGK